MKFHPTLLINVFCWSHTTKFKQHNQIVSPRYKSLQIYVQNITQSDYSLKICFVDWNVYYKSYVWVQFIVWHLLENQSDPCNKLNKCIESYDEEDLASGSVMLNITHTFKPFRHPSRFRYWMYYYIAVYIWHRTFVFLSWSMVLS